MAEIISIDFPLEEIPLYPGRHGYSKYADIRGALLEHGRVKIRVSNPSGLSLTIGVHEGSRIYQALGYWFKRNNMKRRLRGRMKGEILWLWLEDRGGGMTWDGEKNHPRKLRLANSSLA